MTENTDAAVVGSLAAMEDLSRDERLARLASLRRELSLLAVLGLGRRELAFSRVLAALFDEERCAGAPVLWNAFLGIGGLAALGANHADASWTSVKSRREEDHVDVTITARATDGARVIVGIENKIDAGERPGQLRDYQRALLQRHGERAKALVFLNLDGSAPTTHDDTEAVPVVALGYAELIAALRPVAGKLPSAREARVIAEVLDHLEDEMNADRDVKKAVADLCRAHPRAVELLRRHAPDLGDVLGELVAKIEHALGETLEVEVYPARGAPNEIKLRSKRWNAAGLPLTVLIHANCRADDPRPSVCLWVPDAAFLGARPKLEAWAIETNERGGVAGRKVDAAFPPVSGWSAWRRTLAGVDFEDEVVAEAVFDPALLVRGVEEVVRLVRGSQSAQASALAQGDEEGGTT